MWIVSTLLEYIRFTDVYNLYELNHKVNSFDTEYTADGFFNAFIGARFYFDLSFKSYFYFFGTHIFRFKPYLYIISQKSELQIEDEGWENMTTALSVRISHFL